MKYVKITRRLTKKEDQNFYENIYVTNNHHKYMMEELVKVYVQKTVEGRTKQQLLKLKDYCIC